MTLDSRRAKERVAFVTRAVQDIELPDMLAVSVLLWPLALTRRRLLRIEAGFLPAAYAAFVIWLALPK